MLKTKVNNELKEIKKIFTKKDNVMEQIKKIYKTQKRLPTEYQEVEYIQFSGTQWLNINHTATNNTKLYIDLKLTQEKAQSMIGAYASSYIGYSLLRDSDNYSYRSYSSTLHSTIPKDVNVRHKISLERRKLTIDKIEFTNTSPDYTGDLLINTLIGCRMNNGNPNYFAYMNLYSSKVWENNILIRNLIPCYRKSDNETGLYDLINDVFYTNQGTGTFTKGNDVNFIKIFDNLPNDYQEVEYIATDGDSYLDTGIIPDITKTYDFYCDWYVPNSGDQVLLGARMDTGNTRLFPFACAPSMGNLYLNIGYTTYNYGYEQEISLNTRLKCTTHFEQGSQSWKEENQTKPNSRTLSFSEGYDFNKSLHLFRNNYSSPTPCKSGTIVYMLKVFENGKLILNLIPCYRKSDNEIGMYDIVSNTFLTNQGTGTFTKGGDC